MATIEPRSNVPSLRCHSARAPFGHHVSPPVVSTTGIAVAPASVATTPSGTGSPGIGAEHNPKCLGCEAVCWLISADVTDHIVPRRENRSLFWDEADLQSACAWHHDTVEQRLEARHRSGAIDASALRLDSAGAIALDRR